MKEKKYDRWILMDAIIYHERYEEVTHTIEAIELLNNKLFESSKNNFVILEPSFIENILFIRNEDGTKRINKNVLSILRKINADLKNVCFDNVHVASIDFRGLKNVLINLENVPNLDISSSCLSGVTLKGSLDGAKINGTNFEGYIGKLTLDPSKIQDKNLKYTHLSNMTIDGSFDDVSIENMKISNCKGNICINPQTVKDKNIRGVDFNGINLIGNYSTEQANGRDDPDFSGCDIHTTKFKGCIGNIVIDLNTTLNPLIMCDITGVTILNYEGNEDKIGIGTYYVDKKGNVVYINSKKDLQNNEEKTQKGIKLLLKIK